MSLKQDYETLPPELWWMVNKKVVLNYPQTKVEGEGKIVWIVPAGRPLPGELIKLPSLESYPTCPSKNHRILIQTSKTSFSIVPLCTGLKRIAFYT